MIERANKPMSNAEMLAWVKKMWRSFIDGDPDALESQRTLERYFIAFAIVSVFALVRILSDTTELRFVMLYPALCTVALIAGGGPTFVVALISIWLVHAWPDSSKFADNVANNWLPIGSFLLTGFTASMISAKLKTALLQVAASRKEIVAQEHLLKSVIAGLAEGVFVRDLDGNYLIANTAYVEGFVQTSGSIVGKNIRELFPPELVKLLQEDEKSISCSTGPVIAEVSFPRRDGSVGTFVKTKGSICDANGTPVAIFGVLRDITQEREYAKKLLQARVEAEKANRSKSKFLASVSHDLRQPLAAGILHLKALQSSPAIPERERTLIDDVARCALTQEKMLSDLLEVSLLSSKVDTEPHKKSFYLDDVIQSVLISVEPEAENKNLSLRYRHFGITLFSDPSMFQRIVSNLVFNAVRYTNEGGILIACRRRRGALWLDVWDTGIGISPDDLPAIFDEFVQLNNPARNIEQGSGLGLPIVAKSAALLGLKVEVCSRPGRGSRFSVELPEQEAHQLKASQLPLLLAEA